MTTTKRSRSLTLERLIADSERGYLNDRVEEYLPDSLFGPPTAAERAAAAPSRNGRHRAQRLARLPVRLPNRTPKAPASARRGSATGDPK